MEHQHSPEGSHHGDMQPLEIDSPISTAQATRNGLQHTAIHVEPERNGHEGISRKQRKAEEKAGLLQGAPLSSSAAVDEPDDASDDGIVLGAHPKDFVHPIPTVERYYAVSLFCVVAALLYADQNLMAPNLTQIQHDFGFTDTEKDQYLGGWIGAAFFLVGAPAAILMGYYASEYNRCTLFFWVVVLGEAPCAATVFVTKYWHLLLLRLLTGISLGGIFPLVFSLVGDFFSVHQRPFVAALIQIAMGAGMSLGQLVAGVIGPYWGWRAPFLVIALPTIALAVLTWYTIKEPQRGITEAALQGDYEAADFEYEEKIDWEKTKRLIKIRTNLCVILQGMPGSLPWGMLLVFFNDFLAQQKGFSIPAATLVVTMFGLGGGVGIILGGVIGQYLYNKRRRWMPLFTGLIVITSAPPMMWLVNDPLHEPSAVALACVAVFLGGFSASACGPSIRAMIMNVNEPETRGVALALHVVLDDLGKGLGPAAVAVLITALGRQFAFSLSVAGWIPCGLLILGAYFTLESDEDAMQDRLLRAHHSAQQSRMNSRVGSSIALAAMGSSSGGGRKQEDDPERQALGAAGELSNIDEDDAGSPPGRNPAADAAAQGAERAESSLGGATWGSSGHGSVAGDSELRVSAAGDDSPRSAVPSVSEAAAQAPPSALGAGENPQHAQHAGLGEEEKQEAAWEAAVSAAEAGTASTLQGVVEKAEKETRGLLQDAPGDSTNPAA